MQKYMYMKILKRSIFSNPPDITVSYSKYYLWIARQCTILKTELVEKNLECVPKEESVGK